MAEVWRFSAEEAEGMAERDHTCMLGDTCDGRAVLAIRAPNGRDTRPWFRLCDKPEHGGRYLEGR